MVWSNQELTVAQREMIFGTLNCVTIGESGREKKEVKIPSEWNIEEGLNEGLSIDFTKTRHPRIVKIKDDKLFLIIDTKKGYESEVYISDKNKFRCVAYGKSSGCTIALVLEVIDSSAGVFFRIILDKGYPSELFYIKNNEVISLGTNEDDNIALVSDHLGIIVPGFDYKKEEFDGGIWTEVTGRE